QLLAKMGHGCFMAQLRPNRTSSSRQSGQPSLIHDLSGQALTDLYNSPVYKAEQVVCPLGSSSAACGPFSHSGVLVTLAHNSQHLIHKGSGYGKSSQTVVTDARHMSSAWQEDNKPTFKRRFPDVIEASDDFIKAFLRRDV
uniref:Uncharacterized protein n=1 Tax=Acanthochromis polyacanthus TaxID=80966 RepID=A0A3Q1FMJ7_9TELE